MAYKDKNKQREANRQASQRKRNKQKGMTRGVMNQGMTVIDELPNVIPQDAVLDKCEQRLLESKPKRGKDIKCFEDLHPEIQATIKGLSTDKDGILDEAEFKRRTAIAIHYQHIFPDRYEPKSMAMSGDYPMTAKERASYKLASELGPNEHNPVSKPCDGICTPEWVTERTTE